VRSRYLAIGAAVWAAGYAGVYAAAVTGQGNAPSWWYLALLAAGAGSLAVAATRRWLRSASIFGAACLALAGCSASSPVGGHSAVSAPAEGSRQPTAPGTVGQACPVTAPNNLTPPGEAPGKGSLAKGGTWGTGGCGQSCGRAASCWSHRTTPDLTARWK